MMGFHYLVGCDLEFVSVAHRSTLPRQFHGIAGDHIPANATARMHFDRAILNDIDSNLRTLEIDEIKRRLEPLMIGYGLESPILDPGTFLYRARKCGPDFHKDVGIARKDLIYPPADRTRLGRMNRPGQPIFYSSVHKESVFFELPDLNVGDELILTFWKTAERMFVNNIGYTEHVFAQFGAKRAVPSWPREAAPSIAPSATQTVELSTIPPDARDAILSSDNCRAIKEAFSSYFMRKITDDESFGYKLTVALCELHLGSIVNHNTQFAGVLYPSTRMWANGDNLAVLPWFVDAHLEFRKAVHVRIKTKAATTFGVDYLDAAHEFDLSGKLNWLGRVRNWTLQPKQAANFVFEPGRDSDGDFLLSTDGVPCHWIAKDARTDQVIERM
jgi:hypothetical protein